MGNLVLLVLQFYLRCILLLNSTPNTHRNVVIVADLAPQLLTASTYGYFFYSQKSPYNDNWVWETLNFF